MMFRQFIRNLHRSHIGPRPNVKPVDYAVCIDIECTCDSPLQINPIELIEIACLKLDLTDQKLKSTSDNPQYPTFQRYVKPVINPELTLFCQDLTGILQSTVESADGVEKVTSDLLKWLQEEELIDEKYEKQKNFAFASCGNFDLNVLSPIMRNCQFDKRRLPIYFKEWINVKKTFVNHKKEWPRSLYHMLDILGKEPSGRLHSAVDDCRNLAKIVECLHLDGCGFITTNKLRGGGVDDNAINSNNKLQLGLSDL